MLLFMARVAPGHGAGRGLKLVDAARCDLRTGVAPGHGAGRGLKRRRGAAEKEVVRGGARSWGRARIETSCAFVRLRIVKGGARSWGRARIETCAPPNRSPR